MKKQTDYKVTAVTIIVHVLALAIGFNILAVVFEFPEILRESAEYRFTLFTENSAIIVPAYYLLSLTGFTQIVLSVMLYQSFDDRKSSLMLMTMIFGILTGIFQVLGFIRWPIVVPYFAEAMNSGVPIETVAFVEGMLNRYAGMAIGEHLGFLAQGTWTIMLGAMMLRHKLFDSRLGWVGIAIGLLTFPVSMETLGGFFTIFGEWAWPVNAAWNVWLTVIAVSLLRTDEQTQEGMAMGWKTAVASTLVWIGVVIPAFL